jgi:hypothetical protein
VPTLKLPQRVMHGGTPIIPATQKVRVGSWRIVNSRPAWTKCSKNLSLNKMKTKGLRVWLFQHMQGHEFSHQYHKIKQNQKNKSGMFHYFRSMYLSFVHLFGFYFP